VTADEYAAARRAVIAGEDPSAELLAQCHEMVVLMARNSGLPAHYSPYGVWSDEAIEEVYADWVAERLVARGQLRAMLQRAPVLKVFRRMAETSIRQHLIDRLPRSQASNLYERVGALLNEGEFVSSGTGTGRRWSLTNGPDAPFDGDDRQLLSVAWSLGEFQVIRYDLEAKKLSPLLEGPELERFVNGMLAAGAMTAGMLVHALRLRFGLEESETPSEIPEDFRDTHIPTDRPELAELVTATLAELSDRQARVLVGVEQGLSVRELADQLGCSTGTISYERSRIAEILARLGTDAPSVLKDVLDALFKELK
jgi:RNA polymerase sigma factor (sigma-70 family)